MQAQPPNACKASVPRSRRCSHRVNQVQQRLRRVEPDKPNALFARVVEDLGVLVEVKAPGLVPLGLQLEDAEVPMGKNVPIESVLWGAGGKTRELLVGRVKGATALAVTVDEYSGPMLLGTTTTTLVKRTERNRKHTDGRGRW